MSLVYLNYHTENVADLEKSEEIPQQRTNKRYNSCFSTSVRNEASQRQVRYSAPSTFLLTKAGKHERKTMGLAEIPLPEPKNFLKKRNGIKWQRQPEHICNKDHYLPPLPTLNNAPNIVCSKKHPSHRNFIAFNIEAIKHFNKKRTVSYIDIFKGERHDLENAGLIPKYVKSACYGKVPTYIKMHKQQLQKIKQCERSETEPSLPYGVRLMSEKERRDILFGLKTNYTDLSRAYHKLSLVIDTVSKKQQKTNLDKQLLQLEQDILLMECNPVIYVSQY